MDVGAGGLCWDFIVQEFILRLGGVQGGLGKQRARGFSSNLV